MTKEKFNGKYRIESARLPYWDYGWNASYFVTICTQNRTCFFGDVTDGKMQLSEIGVMANDCWLQIPEYFPFVKLGEHVVMPNHVHGIIIIDKTDGDASGRDAINDGDAMNGRDAINRVSTNRVSTTKPKTGGFAGNKNPMGHTNLSRIIRWYKGRTTFESRKIHADFAWQSRFHDHIIRNEKSFTNISNYIATNPLNWNNDTDVIFDPSLILSISK